MATVLQPAGRDAREEAVVAKALVRAADRLGLTNRELARILGLSEASVSRLRRRAFRPGRHDKAFELAVLLLRLYRSLDAVCGGDLAVMRRWLRSPNEALGGVPLARISSVTGLVDVVAYLDSRRAVL